MDCENPCFVPSIIFNVGGHKHKTFIQPLPLRIDSFITHTHTLVLNAHSLSDARSGSNAAYLAPLQAVQNATLTNIGNP